MDSQKSNKKNLLNINKIYQIKLFFLTIVITSFFILFYFNETLAVVDKIVDKSYLNTSSSSSSLQIQSKNNIKINNNSELVFSNITNITNNQKDSVYAQIAATGNNVYMIWQESVT